MSYLLKYLPSSLVKTTSQIISKRAYPAAFLDASKFHVPIILHAPYRANRYTNRTAEFSQIRKKSEFQTDLKTNSGRNDLLSLDTAKIELRDFEVSRTVEIMGRPVIVEERDLLTFERHFIDASSTFDWTVPLEFRMKTYDSAAFIDDSLMRRAHVPPNYMKCAAKLWLACVFAVKEVFLPIGIHSISHRGLKSLAIIAINHFMDGVQRVELQQAWSFGEDFHQYSYGRLNFDHRDFDERMEYVHDFVTTFRSIEAESLAKTFNQYGLQFFRKMRVDVNVEERQVEWGRKSYDVKFLLC